MSESSISIHAALADLAKGRGLSALASEEVFEQLLLGNLDAGQIASLLSLIEAKGASADELVGAATSMRRHVTPVPLNEEIRARVIDTCGTGGAPKLFNVSTIAALVAAGAGAKVVKHGNRSRTGRGSAEIMQALGVNVEASPEVQAKCVEQAGLCFCFAIHHHPATRAAAPVRKSLGFPTIFNLLGPLTNPGRATRQLLGVSRTEHVRIVAEALSRLGCTRAMVVHADDGFDELSTTSSNLVAHVEGESVRTVTIHPEQFGLSRSTREALQADSLEEAVGIARDVLHGKVGAKGDMVLLNAGAAMYVSGEANDLREGIGLARAAVDTGRALGRLDALRAASHHAESSN
ncbi:MAG: anthranilate phosphoribosyltransferase [Phycisphaeraceae bacterium]|nr:anthranilate phosphoribosyltransferase [Phycisphaeraceae bacterium]